MDSPASTYKPQFGLLVLLAWSFLAKFDLFALTLHLASPVVSKIVYVVVLGYPIGLGFGLCLLLNLFARILARLNRSGTRHAVPHRSLLFMAPFIATAAMILIGGTVYYSTAAEERQALRSISILINVLPIFLAGLALDDSARVMAVTGVRTEYDRAFFKISAIAFGIFVVSEVVYVLAFFSIRITNISTAALVIQEGLLVACGASLLIWIYRWSRWIGPTPPGGRPLWRSNRGKLRLLFILVCVLAVGHTSYDSITRAFDFFQVSNIGFLAAVSLFFVGATGESARRREQHLLNHKIAYNRLEISCVCAATVLFVFAVTGLGFAVLNVSRLGLLSFSTGLYFRFIVTMAVAILMLDGASISRGLRSPEHVDQSTTASNASALSS